MYCLKETAVPIESAFSIESSEDKTSPVTIQLKNESYGADEYEWTFEGGTPSSSNGRTPGKVVFTQAGATTLEVIHNAQKYIPNKYYNTLSNLQLEDLITYADDAGDFRFDIKWSALDPETNNPISVFIDTKNYSSASDMFKNLGQFKAYLGAIDNFDNLYIIQQGGRGVTREQIINRLRKELLKPENLIEVFKIIRSKPSLNRELLENIKNDNEALERLTLLIQDPKSVIYTSVQTTK